MHERDLGWERRMWLLEVDGPSLVLGSTQDIAVVDRARAARHGVAVARRRSGGGAVWLDESAVWIDVTISRGDLLWDDDVVRSGLWLGRAWAGALRHAGLGGATVVESGTRETGPGRATLCFAAVAPGEVVDATGRKLVGISQRRTREGARFQCVAYRSWDPARLARCMADRAGALALDGSVVGTVPIGADDLLASLRHEIVAQTQISLPAPPAGGA